VIVSGKLVAQGTLEELRGHGSLTIVARPVDVARTVLRRVLTADQLHEEGGRFRIEIDPGQAAALNRALVMSDVEVSELRVVERSLEDVFLQLTGEESVVSPIEATA
jgi:ABC-2 type transport system ATP-binding protein